MHGLEAQSLFSSDKLDTAEMEHVCSLCPHLLSHCDAPEPPPEADEAAALVRALLREAREAGEAGPVEVAALRVECVAGRLNCPFDDDNEAIAQVARLGDRPAAELARGELVEFAAAALLRATLLRALLLRASGGEEGEGRRWCAALLRHRYFLEQLEAALRDCAVVGSLHDGYAFVSSSLLVRFAAALAGGITHLIRNSPVCSGRNTT